MLWPLTLTGPHLPQMLAAAATADPSQEWLPWVQGVGPAALVSGIVWFARQLATGKLVPRQVASTEDEIRAQIQACGDREAAAMALAESFRTQAENYHQLALEARGREQSMMKLLGKVETMLEHERRG